MASHRPAGEPLKVLHVASGDLWAGAEAQVFNLLRALQRRDEVRVAALLFNDTQMARRLRDAGIAVEIQDESRLTAPGIARRMRALLRDHRPDIVHSHGKKENVLALLASSGLGVGARVATVHGGAEHRPPPLRLDKQLSEWLDRYATGRRLDALVAVSAPLGRQLQARFPRQRVETISNGVDCQALAQAVGPFTLPGGPSGLKVGFVARLMPVKRVDLFLKAAAELEQRRDDLACYVVGDGPELPTARALAQDLGLRRTHFLGFVGEIPSLLAQLDVVCITSDHEGLPMNLLEALALNRGVAAHAVGAIPEVIARCGGIALQERSAASFADAVEQLAEQRPWASGITPDVGSSALIQRHYSADASAAAHLELYQRLLSRSAAP